MTQESTPSQVQLDDEQTLQLSADKRQQYLQNNQFYSPLFKQMAEHLESDSVVRDYRLNIDDERIPVFMRSYKYDVSPWPFILSENNVSQLDDMIKQLVCLSYRAIDLFFAGDSEYFARYLDEPSMVYMMLQQKKLDPRDFLIRHDAIYADGAFKLLEINVGSNCGGWQHDWLKELFSESMQLSDATKDWDLNYRHVTENTFKAVADSIARSKPAASGNVLLYVTPEEIEEQTGFSQSYSSLYQRVSPFTDGQLYFCTDLKTIEFCHDGSIKFQGKEMDAVLLGLIDKEAEDKSILMRLISSYLADQIVLPDSPLHLVLGNKSLMALLHEPKLQSKLSESEQAFIQRHILWTAKVNQTEALWQGQLVPLASLLKTEQHQLVLKKAHSAQGKDVFIGRYMSAEQWANCIDEVKDDNDWLIQLFCKPEPVIASTLNSRQGCYDPVWGVFDLGNSYKGAFVRAIPSGGGSGIINSANGALEFTVLEQAKKAKQKIEIKIQSQGVL